MLRKPPGEEAEYDRASIYGNDVVTIQSKPMLVKENRSEPSSKKYKIVKETLFNGENFLVYKKLRFLFITWWAYKVSFTQHECALYYVQRELFTITKEVLSYHP